MFPLFRVNCFLFSIRFDLCSVLISAGCCKTEFDSTYPIHLNGIIGQQEFHDSIEKINSTITNARKYFWMVMCIFFVGIFISMACFIVGGVSATNSHRTSFPPLIGVATGLSVITSIIFIIVIIIVRVRYTSRLREAIAEESMKYSTRSPTPCSWRLETISTYFGGYGNGNRNIDYHVSDIDDLCVHNYRCS